jgi:subtilisin-like proprotein convertase family protein
VTLNLDGTGAYDTVTVGISAVAESLPAGPYAGTVSFTNLTNGTGNTTRSVKLDVGRVVHGSMDTPRVIVDRTTISSTIQISEAYCIGDVDVDIDIVHTYIGDLVVDLQSPGGTTVRLHNHTGGSADNIVRRYDDEGTPPDGPGELADFDLESTAGAWTLFVLDAGGGDTGTLNNWALRIAPTSGDCPAAELIHSFLLDSDPGWTREGQWQFGQPTGGGSHNGDPTGGYTGVNVFGYNLTGDYANSMGQTYYLTTTPIDCSNITGTRLWFRRWLGVESSLWDHASIQVSNDGTGWTAVWENDSVSIGDSMWSYRAYDISSVADQQATVYVRWGMGPTDPNATYPGWNIDDVEVWGLLQVGDCNHNGITDDCDLDCGEPGGVCDVPGCGQKPDCNGNGAPDECDIADETSQDCDGNGVPDECECVQSAAPTPEPDAVQKNRYVSFAAGNAGCPTALRVTLTDLPAPFDAFDGATRWVGPPRPVTEASGSAASTPLPVFTAANLQAAPHCMDWSTVGVMHVFDEEIVPGGQYDIQAIHCDCDPGSEASYSAALTVFTTRWGDLVGSCAGQSCTPPDGDADFEDISALVDKYKGLPGAVQKARADLAGDVPDAVINFLDISSAVDAFRGLAYPFDGP